VIRTLLKAGTDALSPTKSGQLPIEIAGSSLAYQAVDVFLDDYVEKNIINTGIPDPTDEEGIYAKIMRIYAQDKTEAMANSDEEAEVEPEEQLELTTRHI
jgi:hypothetical protein